MCWLGASRGAPPCLCSVGFIPAAQRCDFSLRPPPPSSSERLRRIQVSGLVPPVAPVCLSADAVPVLGSSAVVRCFHLRLVRGVFTVCPGLSKRRGHQPCTPGRTEAQHPNRNPARRFCGFRTSASLSAAARACHS